MVKWPKTPPFHGGNPGSSPGGVTNGRLAQLGERLPYKQDVGGSSPSSPTKYQYHLNKVVLVFLGLAGGPY